MTDEEIKFCSELRSFVVWTAVSNFYKSGVWEVSEAASRRIAELYMSMDENKYDYIAGSFIDRNIESICSEVVCEYFIKKHIASRCYVFSDGTYYAQTEWQMIDRLKKEHVKCNIKKLLARVESRSYRTETAELNQSRRYIFSGKLQGEDLLNDEELPLDDEEEENPDQYAKTDEEWYDIAKGFMKNWREQYSTIYPRYVDVLNYFVELDECGVLLTEYEEGRCNFFTPEQWAEKVWENILKIKSELE